MGGASKRWPQSASLIAKSISNYIGAAVCGQDLIARPVVPTKSCPSPSSAIIIERETVNTIHCCNAVTAPATCYKKVQTSLAGWLGRSVVDAVRN